MSRESKDTKEISFVDYPVPSVGQTLESFLPSFNNWKDSKVDQIRARNIALMTEIPAKISELSQIEDVGVRAQELQKFSSEMAKKKNAQVVASNQLFFLEKISSILQESPAEKVGEAFKLVYAAFLLSSGDPDLKTFLESSEKKGLKGVELLSAMVSRQTFLHWMGPEFTQNAHQLEIVKAKVSKSSTEATDLVESVPGIGGPGGAKG